MRPLGLIAACALTAIVVAEAGVLRFGWETPGDIPLPDRVLVVLTAAALLIVAVLAVPRARGLAWAMVTLAAGAAAVEVVAAVRGVEVFISGSTWRDLSLLAAFALVVASSIAVAFAARDWRTATGPARGSLLLLGATAVVTAGASLWAVVQAGSPVETGQLSPLRTAARIGIATIVGGFLVGAARDLLPPARTAWALARRADAPAGARLWTFLSALADELLPSRVAGRRIVAESERARLAADLHALVLPDLRRAAATAEAAGMPPEVQVDLRRALEDVEQLMHERQSIVLEQFGLVAALEWLAERTEERSRLRVEIELDGDSPDRSRGGEQAIAPAVARAAFRIALLALDNVVRHAGASIATIRLSTAGQGLRLRVTDDGTASSEGDGKAGRGIADMRAAAASTGGTIEFEARGDPGRGTRVLVAWPVSRAASNHATRAEDATDRTGTPTR